MESSSIDARGARLALRMYIKWAWVLVVALVGGFFVGSSMSSSTVVVGESELTIGLTDEVRWPFYDAVLVRQQGLIEDYNLAETTGAATGIEPISVAVVSENTQNSTLNVLVKINGSSEDARVFADELGRQLVDANVAAQSEAVVAEVADLQSQLDEQDALVLQYETEIADLTDEWVLIQDELVVADPGDAPELRGLAIESDRNRRIAERRLDGVIAAQSSLTGQLATAERELSSTASPVEVSRSATAVEGSSTDLAPVLAILNFLLALLAVPFLERAFGRVSVMDQLGLVFPDAKLIDARHAPTGAVRPVDVVALSVKSLAADRGVAGSAAKHQPSSVVVVAEAAPAAVTEAVVDAIGRDGRGHVTQVDLETPEGLHDAVDADQVVLIVPTRSVRVGRAREMANDLALLDAAPEIVVLSKKVKRRHSSDSHDEPVQTPERSERPVAARSVAETDEPELFDGRAVEAEGEGTDAASEPRRRRFVSAYEPEPAAGRTMVAAADATTSGGSDRDRSESDRDRPKPRPEKQPVAVGEASRTASSRARSGSRSSGSSDGPNADAGSKPKIGVTKPRAEAESKAGAPSKPAPESVGGNGSKAGGDKADGPDAKRAVAKTAVAKAEGRSRDAEKSDSTAAASKGTATKRTDRKGADAERADSEHTAPKTAGASDEKSDAKTVEARGAYFKKAGEKSADTKADVKGADSKSAATKPDDKGAAAKAAAGAKATSGEKTADKRPAEKTADAKKPETKTSDPETAERKPAAATKIDGDKADKTESETSDASSDDRVDGSTDDQESSGDSKPKVSASTTKTPGKGKSGPATRPRLPAKQSSTTKKSNPKLRSAGSKSAEEDSDAESSSERAGRSGEARSRRSNTEPTPLSERGKTRSRSTDRSDASNHKRSDRDDSSDDAETNDPSERDGAADTGKKTAARSS